jgi:hypothetical protein
MEDEKWLEEEKTVFYYYSIVIKVDMLNNG